MLLKIREKTQSWIAWLIVGLISVPFALFGIESYISTSVKVVVAEVNGEEILNTDFDRAFNNYRYQMRNLFGNKFDPELFNMPSTKKTVLDNLIDQRLVAQYLDDNGFGIPDSHVIREIQNESSFQTDKQFDVNLYKRLIASQGYSEEAFEAQLRTDLKQRQFQESFTNASFITQAEVDEITRLQSQKRQVSLLKIPASKIKVSDEISDEEINKFYQDNKDQFVNPEALKLEYVELATQDIFAKVTVSNTELKQAYADNESNLKTSELRELSHIMILSNSAKENKRQKKRIDKIYKRLMDGESFASLASKKSEDTGSADRGGKLGYKTKTDLDPALAKELFKMEVGTISKPIRSKFGFHILKLHRIKASKTKTFNQAKKELIDQQKLIKAEQLFAENAEDFSNLAYEQPNTINSIASAFDLPIKNSDWVTRSGGQGIFSNPKVTQVAFNPEVIENKQNSEVVEIGDDYLMVMRMIDHRPKRYLEIDEIKDEIREQIIAVRKSEAIDKKGEELVNQLKSGANPQKIAHSLRLRWSKKTTYKQEEDNELSADLKDVIFSLPHPEGKAAYGGVLDEKYIIVALHKVDHPKANDKKAMEILRNGIRNTMGNINYKSFVKTLRSKADLNVFYEQLTEEY